MPSIQHTPEPAVFRSEKGAINGVASLDSNGLVPNSQLPGATQSAAGTMSAADKTKLDGIATGATAVTIIDNLTTDDATKALSAKQGKALNDQIGTYSDNVTYTTLSAITSMLTTVASTLVVNQTKNIRIHTGTDTNLSPFTAWNDFSGYMTKYSATYWACFFVGIDGQDVEVGCNNGTITCRSLNTQITTVQITDMTSEFGAVSGTVKLIRWSKIRILAFDSAKAPSAGYFTFSGFSAGDCPSYYAHGLLDRDDNHTAWKLWVRPAGTIGQSNYSASTTASGSVIWVVS